MESPPLAGPIGFVKPGLLCRQRYLTMIYIIFATSRTLYFPFHSDSKRTEKRSLVVSGDGHNHTDLALYIVYLGVPVVYYYHSLISYTGI